MKSIYKYLHEDRIEDILVKNTLRFTQRKCLNDPFELNPVIKGIKEGSLEKYWSSSDIKKIRKYASLNVKTKEERKAINLATDEQLLSFFQNGTYALEAYFEMLEKKIGVLSLTKNRDNLLMWSHYANEHEGFVVEFDKEHTYFNQNKNTLASLRRVNYNEIRPEIEIDLNENQIEIFLTKSKKWEYEEEFRVFNKLKNADFIKGDIHLFSFPKDLIKSIYMGVRMEEKNKNIIRKIIKNNSNFAHVKLYDMSLSEKKFTLIEKEE